MKEAGLIATYLTREDISDSTTLGPEHVERGVEAYLGHGASCHSAVGQMENK